MPIFFKGPIFYPTGVLKTLTELFSNISSIRWQDTTLGIASIIILLIMKVRIQDQNKVYDYGPMLVFFVIECNPK
jgi:hypothetical protein